MTRDVIARMRRLRWTGFALVSLSFVLSFFHRMAPAAIAGELREAFHASGVELGALAATYFVIYTVMQIPTGVLVDTLGPRRVVTLGGLVAGLGSLLFGTAGTLGMAAAGRALVGLGVSVAFISLLKLNAAWFRDREFATVAGLTNFTGNVGAVLSAAPLAWVVAATSWRGVFVATGLLSAVLGLLTWFMVRDHPGDAGLPSMRELDGQVSHRSHQGHWLDGLSRVARNGATWPGFFVNMGLAGTYLAFAGLWAVPYLTVVHGLGRAEATVHTTAMMISFALGALAYGTLSDRLRRRRLPVLAGGTVYVLSWIPLVAGTAMPAAASLALFAVMGLSGAAFTVTFTGAKEVNPPALSGMATSLVNTGVFLGPTIYQPLVGRILDRGGTAVAHAYSRDDFRLGVAVLMGFAALGLVSALFLKETHGRNLVSD